MEQSSGLGFIAFPPPPTPSPVFIWRWWIEKTQDARLKTKLATEGAGGARDEGG